MKNIVKNNKIVIIVTLITGIIIGSFLGGSDNNTTPADETHQHSEKTEEKTIWTCSMHPQIRMDKPGKCPICGMELIPANDVKSNDAEVQADPNEISMTDEAMKLAEIQTMIVSKSKPEKEVRLLGKVKPDERLFYTQAAHFPGRIEDLYANFTGKKVYKGQPIAKIYSPELITAQKELFEAIKSKDTYPLLYKSARNKLKLWKLTDKQIDDIEKNGKIIEELDVLSDYTGIIIKRKVDLGDHVKEGEPLYELADLSHVWVMFEAYEADLPWLKINDKATFTVQGLGNKQFEGKVTYINPFVDAKTRVAEVRVELNNPGIKLLPEMYANGIVKANLEGIENAIIIPKSAVLWTGKRAIVYVKVPNREMTTFLYREVILGEDVGDFYIVEKGLEEGEEIAVNGVFRIDASAQLAGKKSMMNPTGGKAATGHNHGGMKMDEGEKMDMPQSSMLKIDKNKIPDTFKQQLGEAMGAYLAIKDKLVNDDKNIANEIKALQTKLKKVDMALIFDDAHNLWMDNLEKMTKTLSKMKQSVSIKEQRSLLGELTLAMNNSVENLGIIMPKGTTLYYDYCPMAKSYWYSTEKAIKNPYFGSKMLKCGEVKKTI